MNTQTETHAHKLQAPLSGIFHSTVTQTYSIHIYIFSRWLPPDHQEAAELSCKLQLQTTLYEHLQFMQINIYVYQKVVK